jgi:methyl coenzyme M reductase subunit C-like uncharacterized protein (methanogenesis marker protein 7)
MAGQAPEQNPPDKLEKGLPKKAKEWVNKLRDYVIATHVDQVEVILVPGSQPPDVEIIRAESGMTIRISLYVTPC